MAEAQAIVALNMNLEEQLPREEEEVSSAAPGQVRVGGAGSKLHPRPQKRQKQGRQKEEIGLPEDGFQWHKYGQKAIVGSTFTRAYFRCAQRQSGCPAKRLVDRDRQIVNTFRVTYEGEHNHDPPTQPVRRVVMYSASAPSAHLPISAASSSSESAVEPEGADPMRPNLEAGHGVTFRALLGAEPQAAADLGGALSLSTGAGISPRMMPGGSYPPPDFSQDMYRRMLFTAVGSAYPWQAQQMSHMPPPAQAPSMTHRVQEISHSPGLSAEASHAQAVAGAAVQGWVQGWGQSLGQMQFQQPPQLEPLSRLGRGLIPSAPPPTPTFWNAPNPRSGVPGLGIGSSGFWNAAGQMQAQVHGEMRVGGMGGSGGYEGEHVARPSPVGHVPKLLGPASSVGQSLEQKPRVLPHLREDQLLQVKGNPEIEEEVGESPHVGPNGS